MYGKELVTHKGFNLTKSKGVVNIVLNHTIHMVLFLLPPVVPSDEETDFFFFQGANMWFGYTFLFFVNKYMRSKCMYIYSAIAESNLYATLII